ncbi:hypothetical protein T02_7063 [Trichinella nativa]|uniref:Uncharacterized protein n=1 Tax=Trichinella nativa TaxID=6335 RepID=A0A0V1KNB8_9BILA|nr:hypothetical protein T02_7063 [Trichinella nativa]
MNAGWVGQPYSTLNALHHKWTARIQYLMGDGQAARGNRGRMIGVSIVSGVHNTRSVGDGQVAKGNGRPNDWCKHWRWGTQHCVSNGWVVGEDSTLIMRWKCAEQIYNNELLLEWCGSYVPILLNGGKGNQCECMVDWLAVVLHYEWVL